jgi:hypothetical protein
MMKLYISGVSKESYSAWLTSNTQDTSSFTFLEPYEFFKATQKNHIKPSTSFVWLYQEPWLDIDHRDPNKVAVDIKIWMNLQHSFKSCLSSSVSKIATYCISKKSCLDFINRFVKGDANLPLCDVSNHIYFDPFMESTIKSIAPVLYKTFAALESNTLFGLKAADETLSNIEEHNAARLIAFSNCYRKQAKFDKIQSNLELEKSSLLKELVREQTLRSKAEEDNSFLKENHACLNEQFNLEMKVFHSRIHFAEMQLLEYFETIKALTCVIEDTHHTLKQADHSFAGNIENE